MGPSVFANPSYCAVIVVINLLNNEGNLDSKHIFLHKHTKVQPFLSQKSMQVFSHVSPTRVTVFSNNKK